jgi:S-adenosylmethionine decarboxylase
MCGCCDPYKVIPYLREAFGATHLQVSEQKRGLIA